jgi:hypothetical protein
LSQPIDTIFHRPRGLRMIGITQMSFGLFGIFVSLGLFAAYLTGNPSLPSLGPLYAVVILLSVGVPCLVIGNYVDDLRRNAVVAQVFYSTAAIILTGYFLFEWGIQYHWTVPWFGLSVNVAIGLVAALIVFTQVVFVLYLLVRWKHVVPARGVQIERDRTRARMIQRGLMPTPLSTDLLGSDGRSLLTGEQAQHIMQIRKVTTQEGMAILCSNCGGATPLTKAEEDNTIHCQFCGVRLALGGVFQPCKNHPEYLAAAACAVCGEHFCRRCLTAQEPPVDSRWTGSSVFLCRKCFEGRYRPAVTTTSLVIPIDQLFTKAGSRFSRVGSLYSRFLRKYARIMGYSLEFAGRILASMSHSSHGSDNAGAVVLAIIIAVVAIPVLTGIALLLGAIVVVPILFYAGLVGITVEAVRILRRTDFISLDQVRERGIVRGKPVKKAESPLRSDSRPWHRPDMSQKPGRGDSLFER